MSTPIAQYKLPSRIEIGFDSEAKASIADLKIKLDEVNKNLNARDSGLWLESKRKSNSQIGQIIATAISKQIKEVVFPDGLLKEMSRPDGLLKAMQAESANDAPVLSAPMSVPWENDLKRAAEFDIATADDADTAIPAAIAASNMPGLKQLGQWVFEGQDEQFESASVRQDGFAALWSCKADKLSPTGADFLPFGKPIIYSQPLGYGFDATNWQNSAIDRETVNDVDYLSESVPEIQGMDAREIIIDEYDWLSESVPQITQADMQLIFIKNLSEVLIQRMHSMNRFSEDDYAIGGDKLMAWDILIYEPLNSYAVLIDNRQKPKIADLLFFWDTGAAADANWNTDSGAFAMLRTITEDELPAFRAALEACYA